MFSSTIKTPRHGRAVARKGTTTPTRIVTLLLAILLAGTALSSAAHGAARPTFATRVEANFGSSPFYFSTGDWRAKNGRNWTNLRSGERKIAANFLIEDADVPVSILFTAESYVEPQNRSLYLRLLVDGQPMAPANVVLARGSNNGRAAQSFEFTGLYDEGIHTVEAQWRTDQVATGYVRQVGLLIRQGDVDRGRGTLVGVTPDNGANIETNVVAWQDVPGLQATITNDANDDCLTATVSAEAYASAGDSFLMRALIDGVAAEPSPVVFVRDSGYEGTRSMVFGACDMAPGMHDVQIQ